MASDIRVLHLSTHNEECGIAIFQESVVDSIGKTHPINNAFFDISPNKLKLLSGAEFDKAANKLFKQLKSFDILHIQFEYSFYRGKQLSTIVNGAKSMGKKVIFTLHTPPHARKQHTARVITGMGPRSWVHALYVLESRRRFQKFCIKPLYKADMLIVLSQASKDSFEKYGVPADKMKIIELPVPDVDMSVKSSLISDKLHKKPGDIILSTTGFLAETKGITAAIKALTYLPEKYKLAIIGGSHPSGDNNNFYEKTCDLVYELKLQDRVYITGYVKEDALRDALLRDTDISLYPYDKRYYDYVSSAALNNAIANYLPIVAYRTRTFEESNEEKPFINFSHSATYYELARALQEVNLKESSELTKEYANRFTIKRQASLVADSYAELLGRK